MAILIKKAVDADDLEKVYFIRRKVFVDEQHCPPELEYAHEEESTHFLAIFNGEPCGAARWRMTTNGYKLERFAVLPQYRGKQVGAALLKSVLNDLPVDAETIYLNAQLPAVNFYQHFGFAPVGEIFEEAGIMHRQMRLASGNRN